MNIHENYVYLSVSQIKTDALLNILKLIFMKNI